LVDNLRVGTNVLAVEVHQTSASSSDIVMGASVDVVEVSRAGCTPGYANSVRASLEPFPALGINEVLAVNQNGIADNAGDRDPWIELANGDFMPVSLGSWYLSDSYAALDRWQFPKGSVISGNEFKIVWADGEPNEATATQWHTGFRLSASGGVVALSRLQNGAPAVVDYLEYPALGADQSFGYLSPREEDSAAGLLALPTPGAANAVTPPEITTVDVGANGEITVRWASLPGASYRVDASEALQTGAWSPLGNTTATGDNASFTDTNASAYQTRFYRVVLTGL
jgi:hypothetical protein